MERDGTRQLRPSRSHAIEIDRTSGLRPALGTIGAAQAPAPPRARVTPWAPLRDRLKSTTLAAHAARPRSTLSCPGPLITPIHPLPLKQAFQQRYLLQLDAADVDSGRSDVSETLSNEFVRRPGSGRRKTHVPWRSPWDASEWR
jgi:hypothetical protein